MTAREQQAARIVGPIVGIAAGLLLTVAFLAWRIERRGMETEQALEGIRDSTERLFDLPKVNAALERMTADLESMRREVES